MLVLCLMSRLAWLQKALSLATLSLCVVLEELLTLSHTSDSYFKRKLHVLSTPESNRPLKSLDNSDPEFQFSTSPIKTRSHEMPLKTSRSLRV